MKGLSILSLVIATLIVTASKPDQSEPLCVPKAPAEVLDCLAMILNARDVNALDDLMAEDFVADHKPKETGPTPDPADREQYFKMMKAFFDSERVKSFKFSFSFEGEPQQTGPRTWVLEDVYSTLETHGMVTETRGESEIEVVKPFKVEKVDTFKIRRADEPHVHYVIARWTEGP